MPYSSIPIAAKTILARVGIFPSLRKGKKTTSAISMRKDAIRFGSRLVRYALNKPNEALQITDTASR
jgi:hypothetical protein